MLLYEIDRALSGLIDPKTGEILDFDTFLALQMERDAKIENTCLWYKDLCAEAAAIRAEELSLAERRKAAERKAETLKGYIDRALAGAPFKTARVQCSYRKSSAAEPAEGFEIWAMENGRQDLLTIGEPMANKTAIKAAIKAGEEIPARLTERNNLSIK